MLYLQDQDETETLNPQDRNETETFDFSKLSRPRCSRPRLHRCQKVTEDWREK